MRDDLRPLSLAVAADRRAREPEVSAKPTLGVCGPQRTVGGPKRRAEAAARPLGLTQRERKVRDLLLQELAPGGDVKNLSYADKKRLLETLDVPFIDREAAKAQKKLRWQRRALPALAVAGALWIALQFAGGVGEVVTWWTLLDVGVALAVPLSWGFAFKAGAESARRRLFILEALRELAGADEPEARLSRALLRADAVIDRIVEDDVAADARASARRSSPTRLRTR